MDVLAFLKFWILFIYLFIVYMSLENKDLQLSLM